ncbi:MAG: hypothetical protein HZB38_11625, partial [Planctomycetes bacterium]|nr:hypothetical protein [Planctomycetota bacterium]
GVTAVLLLVVGTFCVLVDRRSNHPMFALVKQVAPLQPLAAFSAFASIRLVVAFAERIAQKAADLAPAPQLPPVCEWCGYDLSHADPAGVCTECGRPIAQSLGVDARRTGCSWENNGAFGDWLASSWHVLTAPGAFYASLKMRGPLEPASSYAQRHLRLIGVGAVTWIVFMWISFRPAFGIAKRQPEDTAVVLLVLLVIAALVGGTSFVRVQPVRLRQRGFLLLPLLAACAFWLTGGSLRTDLEEVIGVSIMLFVVAPLVCWAGYRVGGAFMAGIAVWNRSLPDVRLAEKVILYEAAFLWIFCIAWGLLVSSFMVFGPWMRRLPATAWIGRPLGMPAEPSAILYATAALSAVWAYRYLIAFRAVRWSNF